MTRIIDTKEVMERLIAYQKPGNHLDGGLLITDMIIYMKWSRIPKSQLISEINYYWDKVILPDEKQQKLLKPGMPH